LPSNNPIIRIDAERIALGMRVIELDRPWNESPFETHGFRITTEQQLDQLKNCCEYIYVAAKANTAATATAAAPSEKRQYRNTQTFQQALPAAKNAHKDAKNVVTGFYKTLRLAQSFDSSEAKKAVKQCVDNVISNQEAMLWLGLLKNVDEYTARHSLNVGLLSIILGRAEGLPRDELEMVGLCGMLHDMGKSRIPLDILNKEGSFSNEEFEIMKTHTTLGYEILTEQADITAEVAEVAFSHHERLSGNGYPRALDASKIGYYTRIVAIADTYDAITSKRIYSPSKTSLEGLRILIGAKGTHFDPELVDRFVECIGIYPSGSIAELSSGEIAIVLPSPPELRETPKVLVIRSSDKQICEEKCVDLSLKQLDPKGRPLKIRHLLSDGAFGIKLADHFSAGTEAAS
jgi:HD-GYP domain-containing protein (c-di-GMP phosphodiesterase class II)